jgi:hypothetical protein
VPDGPAIRALLVTNGQYDSRGLKNLDGPGYDKEALAQALEKYGNAQVDLLTDGTADEIQDQVGMFLRCVDPADTALLYFSCHGFRVDQRLRLAARNTRLDKADTTAVEASWVRRQLHLCEAGAKVWILDCCHAAAGAYGHLHEELFKGIDSLPDEPTAAKGVAGPTAAKGVAGPTAAKGVAGPARPARQGRGLVILAASSADQKALDGQNGSPYTRLLVRGITTGAADADRDGWVSADELAHYVHDLLAEELGDRTEELETRHFIEGAAGRIRQTRVDPDPAAIMEPEPPKPPQRPESPQLRKALRDPGGPVTTVVITVLAGAGILLAKENIRGAMLAAILVGIVAYAGYVVVRWLTERAGKV